MATRTYDVRAHRRVAAALVAVLLALAAGCSTSSHKAGHKAGAVERTPRLGACRVLTADAVDHPSNATPTVACAKRHTAETFAVGTLPASTGSSYDDRRHGARMHRTCQAAFERFLAVDESLAMRVRLSWAWFRPSKKAWKTGARWYRCDVIGGPDGATRLSALPTTAKGLFSDSLPDQWLACARGKTFAGSAKVPCSEPHDWRAVTTIKLGTPKDRYPGDRVVQVRTRDYCSDSVGAWMNYPPDFGYGYTWLHAGEWAAGNRRSICWAGTDR